MDSLYYQPPSDEIFKEVRDAAIEIWSALGDEPSYSKEKIARVESIYNYRDNFMTIISMFDINNQLKLARAISPEAKSAVGDRLISGGMPPQFNVFSGDF